MRLAGVREEGRAQAGMVDEGACGEAKPEEAKAYELEPQADSVLALAMDAAAAKKECPAVEKPAERRTMARAFSRWRMKPRF